MKREQSLRQLNPLAYGSWQAMKQRCLNSNCVAWPDYGDRGITIYQAWRDSFEAFLADMGERPSADYSLERLDRDGNYEPSNCIWATSAEQAANRKFPIGLIQLDLMSLIAVICYSASFRGLTIRM